MNEKRKQCIERAVAIFRDGVARDVFGADLYSEDFAEIIPECNVIFAELPNVRARRHSLRFLNVAPASGSRFLNTERVVARGWRLFAYQWDALYNLLDRAHLSAERVRVGNSKYYTLILDE